MIASLVTLGGSVGAEALRNPSVTSAKQASETDRLVASIKRASREALAKEDWSIMARLYPPDTFSCWIPRHSEKPYSFLSMPAIPEDARHQVERIVKYHYGNRDASKMGATHFVEISYSVPYLARCGDSSKRIVPSRHFFLRPRGDAFELAYPCPGDERNLPPGARAGWPSFDAARARKVAEDMAPAERLAIRKKLLGETYDVGTILNLETQYQVSDEEVYVMINRICELTSGSP